jgi:hypothetical protein
MAQGRNGGFQMVQERSQMPQKNAEESCAEDFFKYHDGVWSHFYEWRGGGGGGGGGWLGWRSVPPYVSKHEDFKKKRHTTTPARVLLTYKKESHTGLLCEL